MADHLFGTSRPPPDPLKIEYHGPVYDGGSWLDYPSRQGWRRPADSRSGGMADKKPTLFIPESHKPRLECWLYFGVLHAVFGPSIQHNDFVRLETNGKRYLTTALLHRYVDVALKAPSSSKQDPPLIFGACTKAAWESVENQLGSLLNNADLRGLLRPEMQFAIRVLHATLFLLVKDTLGLKFRAVLLPQSACRDAWADERLRSSDKGCWCPSEIACFSNLRSVLSQAYALQLRRPARRTAMTVEGGEGGGGGGDDAHALCTAAKCRVNQVESGTYVTKHHPPECRCEHVVVPVEDVKAVLRKGGIPLVRIRGGEGEEAVRLEVVAHRPGRNYVALSHVWSDGLGNAKVNSLPACQLRRLEAKAARLLWEHANVPGAWDNPVSALHVSGRHLLHAAMNLVRNPEEDTLFWVDTLCVPLDEETRKMAIRGMKKVYERGK